MFGLENRGETLIFMLRHFDETMTILILYFLRFGAIEILTGDFSWQKPWGHFLKTVISSDFFPEHKNREKRWNFTKSVIYRDQKSKKLPNDRQNERAVVRILIEISDNSVLAWHCVTVIILDGCFKLTCLSL